MQQQQSLVDASAAAGDASTAIRCVSPTDVDASPALGDASRAAGEASADMAAVAIDDSLRAMPVTSKASRDSLRVAIEIAF